MGALQTTTAAGRRIASELQRLKRSNLRLRDESRTTEQRLVRATASTGAGFGIGYVNGRYGEKAELLGIPPAIVVGILGHAAGFMGFGPTEAMHAIGDGSLTAFTAELGTGLGAAAKADAE